MQWPKLEEGVLTWEDGTQAYFDSVQTMLQRAPSKDRAGATHWCEGDHLAELAKLPTSRMAQRYIQRYNKRNQKRPYVPPDQAHPELYYGFDVDEELKETTDARTKARP